MSSNVLITGGARGIGAGIVRQAVCQEQEQQCDCAGEQRQRNQAV